MPTAAHQDTHHKALAINLDPNIYGTIAEIGAGQEVARWFLQVGGASGTVAKTISAYDMAFSDAIYGKVPRYVSRDRVEGMLDHEYALLMERLGTARGEQARFFVFSDTISARNFAGTNECHGWVGVRFQTTPGGAPSDVILHVNLLDPTNLQQQLAVGILGVNLIWAVFHQREPVESLLAALFDELPPERLEIDLIAVRGPAFEGVDDRHSALALVQGGFASAVLFRPDGPLVPPSEVIRKHPLVLEPGVFTSPEPVHGKMLQAGRRRLEEEVGPTEREPMQLFVLTGRLPDQQTAATATELGERIGSLTALGAGVLVARQPEMYRVVQYALRYTSAPIRIVLGALTLAEVFHSRHYHDLDGKLMEALAQLFTYNVRMYVHPMPAAMRHHHPSVADWVPTADDDGMITLEHIDVPRPGSLLFQYLIESGFLCSVPAA